MCTMNVLSDSSRRKPLRVVKINVFSRNLVRSFLIVFVFCEIFFLQNCVDAQTHNPAYDRRAATLNRRNRLALQRNAVVNLTDLGTLQGSIDETKWTRTPIYRFLGVKYGESPSGNRRFKAPVTVSPWEGVRSAEDYGQDCPTYERLSKMSEAERKKGDIEDCLNLDIYTKQVNEEAKQPVMVYVHGGSFCLGSSRNHPPNYLLEGNIVLVVPQFRLDALGFLSTLSRDIPGNAGLMDVIAALEFVQKHIHKFGGDPNRVTLVGQSSGAAMASALGISPTVSTKLFNQMIIQSGSVYSAWSYGLNPVESARDIAQRAGVSPNAPMFQLNRALMSMDVFELLNATEHHNKDNVINSNGLSNFGGRSLTVGGPSNLVPDTPLNIRRSASYRKDLAIMAGITKDDGSFLTAVIYDILDARKLLTNKSFMKHQMIDTVLRVFGVDDEAGDFTGLAINTYWTQEEILRADFAGLATGMSDLLGTIAFKAPVLRLVHANAIYNPYNTYLYSFDYRGEHTRFGYGEDVSHYPFDGGIHHSNDNIYFFPAPPEVANLNEADTQMSMTMVELWTSFITNGFPELKNTNSSFEWRPAMNVTGPYLHINKELRMAKDFTNEFSASTRDARTMLSKT